MPCDVFTVLPSLSLSLSLSLSPDLILLTTPAKLAHPTIFIDRTGYSTLDHWGSGGVWRRVSDADDYWMTAAPSAGGACALHTTAWWGKSIKLTSFKWVQFLLEVIELYEGSQNESSGQMEFMVGLSKHSVGRNFMLKKVGRSAGVSGSFDLVTELVWTPVCFEHLKY